MRFDAWVVLLSLMLAACSSKGKAVNKQNDWPVWPMAPATAAGTEAAESALSRKPMAALSGKVVLKSDPLPVGLSGVGLGLFKKEMTKWVLVAELTSEIGGNFEITRPLVPGLYELRVLDKKYKGKLPIQLSAPLSGLILEISK